MNSRITARLCFVEITALIEGDVLLSGIDGGATTMQVLESDCAYQAMIYVRPGLNALKIVFLVLH